MVVVVVVLEVVSVELVVLVLLEVHALIPVVSVARFVHNPMARKLCLVAEVVVEEEVVVVGRSSTRWKMPLHFVVYSPSSVSSVPCVCPSSPVYFVCVLLSPLSSRCRRSK